MSCRAVRALGLPPFRPLALAAVSPAVVRSLIRFLSNSASAPKIWKISLPPLVVVSIFSVRLLNPIPRPSSMVIVPIKSLRERPNRSKRQTTNVSLGWRRERASSKGSNLPLVNMALSYRFSSASASARFLKSLNLFLISSSSRGLCGSTASRRRSQVTICTLG